MRGFPPWVMTLILMLMASGRTPAHADETFLRQVSHLLRFKALQRSTAIDPPIRVLVYGQSITAQAWSGRLLERIRAGGPGREWRMENRSIGGHTAEYLLRTAEADLFPFHPDLVIFHAYGSTNAYAELIRQIRTRTCADILLVGNHYASWDHPAADGIGVWDGVMLPELAAELGVCHADIRTPWKERLLADGLGPTSLLLDSVHLNPDGDRLMEELVARYLFGETLQPPVDPHGTGRSRRLPVRFGPEARVDVHLNGSRVLARVDRSRAGTLRITVDGEAPSAHPGGAYHGRTSPWSGTAWPALLAVGAEVPPRPERWTLTIEQVLGPNQVGFRLEG